MLHLKKFRAIVLTIGVTLSAEESMFVCICRKEVKNLTINAFSSTRLTSL